METRLRYGVKSLKPGCIKPRCQGNNWIGTTLSTMCTLNGALYSKFLWFVFLDEPFFIRRTYSFSRPDSLALNIDRYSEAIVLKHIGEYKVREVSTTVSSIKIRRDRDRIWCKWYPWWRYQMETFSALLAICAGNSPVPGEFPAQRPVTRSFDVFFDLHPNKRLSKQWWGWWFETSSCPLWRHRNVHVYQYLKNSGVNCGN